MRAAFIFPGQGSQSIGMGKEIYENFSPASELLQNASDSLKIDFANLLFNENVYDGQKKAAKDADENRLWNKNNSDVDPFNSTLSTENARRPLDIFL